MMSHTYPITAQYYPLANEIVILGEGTIKLKGTWRELQARGTTIAKFMPKSRTVHEDDAAPSKEFAKLSSQLRAKDEAEMDLARKTGDLSLYGALCSLITLFLPIADIVLGYYLRFVGWPNFLLLCCCTASYSFFITIPQYWLGLWTGEHQSRSVLFFVCGYLLLSLISWASTNGTMW